MLMSDPRGPHARRDPPPATCTPSAARVRSTSWRSRSKIRGAEPGRPARNRKDRTAMRILMLVKANKESEAGVLPDEKMLSEMGRYNEQLMKAGALLAAEGLQASSKGHRVKISKGKLTVTDGPFAEAKELVAGFWL